MERSRWAFVVRVCVLVSVGLMLVSCVRRKWFDYGPCPDGPPDCFHEDRTIPSMEEAPAPPELMYAAPMRTTDELPECAAMEGTVVVALDERHAAVSWNGSVRTLDRSQLLDWAAGCHKHTIHVVMGDETPQELWFSGLRVRLPLMEPTRWDTHDGRSPLAPGLASAIESAFGPEPTTVLGEYQPQAPRCRGFDQPTPLGALDPSDPDPDLGLAVEWMGAGDARLVAGLFWVVPRRWRCGERGAVVVYGLPHTDLPIFIADRTHWPEFFEQQPGLDQQRPRVTPTDSTEPSATPDGNQPP